jgi:hypothetical protein
MKVHLLVSALIALLTCGAESCSSQGTRASGDGAISSGGTLSTGGVAGSGGPTSSTATGGMTVTGGASVSGGRTGTGGTTTLDGGIKDTGSTPIDAPTIADTPKSGETGSEAQPADAAMDSAQGCALASSGPVAVSTEGAVIQNLHIVTNGTAGVMVNAKNVTLRNLWIEHNAAAGISFSGADDLFVQNVLVTFAGAPASGPNPTADDVNINGYNSQRVHISGARLEHGSSGIYLVQCPDSLLTQIDGYDFRGPFPRGQLVQWDNSDRGTLDGFSVVNTAASWTEDNVNAYQSLDMQIKNGLVDGNNSPTGVGVIFDGDTSTGVVDGVDAVHMGDGCFSAYAGGEGNIFRNTRCRDNICTDQGRGVPTSNALMWCGKPGLTQLRIENSTYFNPCNPGNIVWPQESFALIQTTLADFTPRTPLDLKFCWQ